VHCVTQIGLLLRLALARLTFSRMSLAFAVQIKGLGWRLCFGYKRDAFLESFDAGKDAAPELISVSRGRIVDHVSQLLLVA